MHCSKLYVSRNIGLGQITWKMLPIPAAVNEYELTHILCRTYQLLSEIVT